MRKKMMVLVVAAQMALTFTALAGTAIAKETNGKCEGAGACTFTVSGGVSNLSIAGGDTVRCESASGSGEVTNLNAERESSTKIVIVLLKGCKEQNTVFHFACSNTATSGNITTNTMTVHGIVIISGTEAGPLVTNAGVTFTCAGGFASTQVTGSIIGESETKCNTNTGTVQKTVVTTTGDGAQSLTSYTGSTFRLEGKTSHTSGGTYSNAAADGTFTVTFNQNVIRTCS
jgi:hypothetical protein